jgi:hypothetical protein
MFVRRGLSVVAVAAALVLTAPAANAQDQPPLPSLPHSVEIQLKVERDGSLSVIEAISVPSGETMTRRVPLRVPAGNSRDRIYGVRNASIEGAGSAELSADAFTIRLRSGTSVVRYTVDGAVSDDQGVQHVSWEIAGGWDNELKLIRATFAAPRIPDAVSCLAGPADSDLRCGAAQIDHAGLTRFSQQNLPAGQRMDVTVELAAGTVPATARLEPSATLAGAFVLTSPVGWAWAGLGVLLGVAAALVRLARRRDRRFGGATAVEVISGTGGQAAFVSPDGVLPGHLGTVLSGRTDAVDLAATVLDLAVRNYLWVSEVDTGDGIPDWRLVRRNPPDEQLTDFERAVFTALLPGDADSVRLSELRHAGLGIGPVRAALYDDLVRRRWFSRPPGRRRGKTATVGIRLCFYGAFLMVLLALTVGYAQLGVVVVVAGIALAAGSRWLPGRTARGVQLRSRLLGLLHLVCRTKADDIPERERGLVFSRVLPYALALGEAGRWVAAFSGLDRSPEAYWYGAGDGQAAPVARVGEFAAALVGTFAGSGEGRRLYS